MNVGENGFSVGKAMMRDGGGRRHKATHGECLLKKASFEHVGVSLVELRNGSGCFCE